MTAIVSAPAAAAVNDPQRAPASYQSSEIVPDVSSSSSSQWNPSSLSSSPREYPADISHPIFEEGTESDSEFPNEPVTPVSGRQSQEFTTLHNQDNIIAHLQPDLPPSCPTSVAVTKPPLVIETAPTPSPKPGGIRRTSIPSSPPASDQTATPPSSRRTLRRSSSSFNLKRTMSNMSALFRRTSSQTNKEFEFDATCAAGSETVLNGRQSKASSQNLAMNKSSVTSRSNSPPSPSSPLEMAPVSRGQATVPTVPNAEDFKKKSRAATGLNFRSRAVNFVSGNGRGAEPKRPRDKRRASSFDGTNKAIPPGLDPTSARSKPVLPDRAPWAFPPEAGTGAKARRMSLSLPDDFFVDVAELLDEYEYQQKFLGRHAKALGKGQLGKGATATVMIMVRKGSPGELYAVKEFRGKSRQESQEEYEKKIKSEYSIAKSLHHPNIVETIRLCTHHGRWNHVMEYCSQGDLHSLVEKGYLKEESRQKDRHCLFKQLVQGVSYLHANGIAHRDIKLENLLITQDSKLKITDFGVSEVFSGTHPGLREAGGVCGKNMSEIRLCSPGICGSEPFIAPEVLAKKDHYDPRGLDVWGIAISMICLIAGGNLWTRASKCSGQPIYESLVKGWDEWNEKHENTADMITDADYPNVEFFDRFIKPPALRRILLQMLNPNPDKRIGMIDITSNRWVKNLECCQLESYEDPTPIDAAKKNPKLGKKIYCHNHLPAQSHGTHSLGAMPGKPGY